MKRVYIVHPYGEFAKWLDRKLKEACMTREELSDYIGVTTATILNYYHRKTYPREWIINELAQLFHTPFDKIRSMLDEDWSVE